MRFLTLILILLAFFSTGCTSQDTTITLRPEINCDSASLVPGYTTAGDNQKIAGGVVMHFEILLDAEVKSDKDATNTPDISPTLSIPLP